jgi:hypothetical protein
MKKIAPWRIALTASAVVVLGVAGLGVVAAADPTSPSDPTPAQRVERVLDRLRERLGDGRFNALVERIGPEHLEELKQRAEERIERQGDQPGALGRALPRFGRNVIHAVVTVDHPQAGVVSIQIDHGTVESVGAGILTIAEKDGTKPAVSTNAVTKVTRNGSQAALTDLAAGDEVYVISRLEGGTATATRIFAPKPTTD